MLRALLVCGLVAGFCAGLVGFGIASLAGEGAVDVAIEFEEAQAAAGEPDEPAVVGRGEQKGIGLATATVVYGLALGGIFALVFAAAYGRVARVPPARTAAWLAVIAFVVVFLVPFAKYPANPPATGDLETIQERTLLYLTMVAVSALSALAAVRVRALALRRELPRGQALGAAIAGYGVLVGIAMAILPGVEEIPPDFPATALYDFRAGTVLLQAGIWATIGLVFAALAGRRMDAAASDARVGRDPGPA